MRRSPPARGRRSCTHDERAGASVAGGREHASAERGVLEAETGRLLAAIGDLQHAGAGIVVQRRAGRAEVLQVDRIARREILKLRAGVRAGAHVAAERTEGVDGEIAGTQECDLQADFESRRDLQARAAGELEHACACGIDGGGHVERSGDGDRAVVGDGRDAVGAAGRPGAAAIDGNGAEIAEAEAVAALADGAGAAGRAADRSGAAGEFQRVGGAGAAEDLTVEDAAGVEDHAVRSAAADEHRVGAARDRAGVGDGAAVAVDRHADAGAGDHTARVVGYVAAGSEVDAVGARDAARIGDCARTARREDAEAAGRDDAARLIGDRAAGFDVEPCRAGRGDRPGVDDRAGCAGDEDRGAGACHRGGAGIGDLSAALQFDGVIAGDHASVGDLREGARREHARALSSDRTAALVRHRPAVAKIDPRAARGCRCDGRGVGDRARAQGADVNAAAAAPEHAALVVGDAAAAGDLDGRIDRGGDGAGVGHRTGPPGNEHAEGTAGNRSGIVGDAAAGFEIGACRPARADDAGIDELACRPDEEHAGGAAQDHSGTGVVHAAAVRHQDAEMIRSVERAGV